MRVTKEEAEQETRRVPVRTLAFILFTILTSTLIASTSAQPPTPPTPPILTDLNITPAEIEPGNEVTITFTITNSDNQTFTYTATMQIGELTLLIDVELEAYESKKVSRTITQHIPGEYNVTVDSLEGTFTVKHPELPTPPLPPILSNLTITPAEIERGDNVTIGLDIENIDSQSFTYIVTMQIENVNDPPPTWPPYNVTLIYLVYVEMGAYESKTIQHTITPDTVGDFNVTVDGLTGSFTVGTWPPEPPPKPAEFIVSDLSITPEEALVWGDIDVWTFKITVNVTNIGEQEGTHTVDLKVDGEVVDWRTVMLKGGEKTQIIYDVTRGVGSYTVEVDGLTGSFTVKALPGPAEFEFSNLVITPKKVEEGLSVTISVEVTNLSEESLWTPPILVALKLDGVVVDSEEIPPFSGGVTATQYFEVTRGEGTYEVEIEGLTGVFTVKTKLSFWDKIPRFPYESIILGLIAVIIILWYTRAR